MLVHPTVERLRALGLTAMADAFVEAQAVGPDAAVLIDVILRSRPHPEQGFRSCVGILRLVRRADYRRRPVSVDRAASGSASRCGPARRRDR